MEEITDKVIQTSVNSGFLFLQIYYEQQAHPSYIYLPGLITFIRSEQQRRGHY